MELSASVNLSGVIHPLSYSATPRSVVCSVTLAYAFSKYQLNKQMGELKATQKQFCLFSCLFQHDSTDFRSLLLVLYPRRLTCISVPQHLVHIDYQNQECQYKMWD